jgi:hypothetical protein
VIRDLAYIKSRSDIDCYLRERDEYRAKDGKQPTWSQANIALHHKLLGRSGKIGDRVITQRIGLVKKWQWHTARKDNCCQACGEVTTGIAHPLRQCKAVAMIEARAHWWDLVEFRIAKAPLHLQQSLYLIVKHIREDDGGETACCGTFLPHFVNNLPFVDEPITEDESKLILKVLKEVAAGCRRLLRLAAELQLGQLGVNLQQKTITKYYKLLEPPRNPNPTRGLSQGKQKDKKLKNRNKQIIYLNKDLKPHDIILTTNSIDNDFNVLYREFKAG